jgi:deoxyribodipyrimidine photo-lyase
VALKHAKDTLSGLRRTPEARAEADAVQDKHGSRKAGLPATAGKPRRRAAPRAPADNSPQLDLFS